jgi:hypothetical protein
MEATGSVKPTVVIGDVERSSGTSKGTGALAARRDQGALRHRG